LPPTEKALPFSYSSVIPPARDGPDFVRTFVVELRVQQPAIHKIPGLGTVVSKENGHQLQIAQC
jgi:hypothetical protein